MSQLNPDFWELTLGSQQWEQFRVEDGLWHETEEETESRHTRGELARQFATRVEPLLNELLTVQQQAVLRLYFFSGLNQREIAERLGVSQQSVSEHLYGKIRNGHAVGGALRKLRKACAERGLKLDA